MEVCQGLLGAAGQGYNPLTSAFTRREGGT
jgi:hypothetical protein